MLWTDTNNILFYNIGCQLAFGTPDTKNDVLFLEQAQVPQPTRVYLNS